MTGDRLYFRRLLAGSDLASKDPVARQMLNLVYLIGDRETVEAVAVDPAYNPAEVIEILEADGMQLKGVLATHYHADHVGGDLSGHKIAGIAELLEFRDVPVHAHDDEIEWIERATGVGPASLRGHASGDVIDVGKVAIRVLHTPAIPREASASSSMAALLPVTRSFYGLRSDRPSRQRSRRHVRQLGQPPREAPRRDRRLPGSPLLARRLSDTRRDKAHEPRAHATHGRKVARPFRRIAGASRTPDLSDDDAGFSAVFDNR